MGTRQASFGYPSKRLPFTCWFRVGPFAAVEFCSCRVHHPPALNSRRTDLGGWPTFTLFVKVGTTRPAALAGSCDAEGVVNQ
jgi:hypothetical protein